MPLNFPSATDGILWNDPILNWTQGPTMNQEVDGRVQTKGKVTKLSRTKPPGQNCTAMAQLRIPAPIIQWPTADLQVK